MNLIKNIRLWSENIYIMYNWFFKKKLTPLVPSSDNNIVIKGMVWTDFKDIKDVITNYNLIQQWHIISEYIHETIRVQLCANCYAKRRPLHADKYKILIAELKNIVLLENTWCIPSVLIALQYGSGKYKDIKYSAFSSTHWDEIKRYNMTVIINDHDIEVLMLTKSRHASLLTLTKLINKMVNSGKLPFKEYNNIKT